MSRQAAPVTVGTIVGCVACMEHYAADPMLVGACASVGIEHGKSTRRMLLEYLAAYHKDGHAPR